MSERNDNLLFKMVEIKLPKDRLLASKQYNKMLVEYRNEKR
jgi:hypothetical protein